MGARVRLCACLLSTLLPLPFLLPPGAVAHSSSSRPPWQIATSWPDRIVVTHSQDPARSFAVTWRTDASVGRTIAQIVRASADTRFDLAAQTIVADSESVDLERMRSGDGLREPLENVGLGKTHYHSVVFDDLEPDTLYAWRVRGDRGHWSEWVQTRTAPLSGPVSFVYFGDAQNGIRSHWSRVIRAANQAVPDARFFLHAGDLVHNGDSDRDWAEWFAAGAFVHAQTPVIPVPGNHENITVRSEGPERRRWRVRTPLWRAQFTLPEEPALPPRLRESTYELRYSRDLHLFVVDSARDDFELQGAWLAEAVARSDARWKLLAMHHPFFAPEAFDRRRRDAQRRRVFTEVLKEHPVDLVLTGHVHTYARAVQPLTGKAHASRVLRGEPQAVRSVYVVSWSGASTRHVWETRARAESLMAADAGLGNGLKLERVADNTPMFQVIQLDGDGLRYEARTALGEVYDAFELEKDAQGTLTLSNGEAAYGALRVLENTGPYRAWDDLR